MVAFLAVVAVVGYMAKAGLPWWVVAAVALLTAGFAAGVSGGPARGTRSTIAFGPTEPSTDHRPAVPPASVHSGAVGPDDWDAQAPTGAADRALR
ncbi:hypothetical protein IM697_27665 [Streptomyces ferrugineus]|uniref:Uncharacterized protein n=1 Tax=Streptomyces ferrugineus TaxID=1413221 RepID=A0A7M2SC83_9ACTN|nr:hypothetical protein [Streptomyces ferrugineus]QOV33947.1 hypothetical protein IM697_27665 [Streptomyces ferrugineus]